MKRKLASLYVARAKSVKFESASTPTTSELGKARAISAVILPVLEPISTMARGELWNRMKEKERSLKVKQDFFGGICFFYIPNDQRLILTFVAGAGSLQQSEPISLLDDIFLVNAFGGVHDFVYFDACLQVD